jgi:hypothetical protein
MKSGTTVTVTFGKICKHLNGWYIYPRFWIFKRKYFVCSDCGELIIKSKWRLD